MPYMVCHQYTPNVTIVPYDWILQGGAPPVISWFIIPITCMGCGGAIGKSSPSKALPGVLGTSKSCRATAASTSSAGQVFVRRVLRERGHPVISRGGHGDFRGEFHGFTTVSPWKIWFCLEFLVMFIVLQWFYP